MNRKRTKTTNSLKFNVYLPDECWELVFKHLLINDDDYNSLSLVSKQFLSITNRLRSSLTIKSYNQTTQQVLHLIGRFPKLTSLNFYGHHDLDSILPKLYTFPFRLTSLKLSVIRTIPASGLVAFSITSTLNSLTCSHTKFLHSAHMGIIGECFPELQRLDLSNCKNIYVRSLPRLLKECCNITHLNLTASSIIPLSTMMDFQVPTLEVLNLSRTTVNDQTLYIITKTCSEIVQPSLDYCDYVTYKGVKLVLRNCKQLREINLKGVKDNTIKSNVASMVLLRPSLENITF
ncbi:unnamed protein product [Trifolium pratense]|uniref:Uncharacterized protein n=1 Tax=Trifolium pratense TaxID=57577 RepID=A0ACB0KIA0_TRIPR|nr:unnamed protein product [Trifolium pratense]